MLIYSPPPKKKTKKGPREEVSNGGSGVGLQEPRGSSGYAYIGPGDEGLGLHGPRESGGGPTGGPRWSRSEPSGSQGVQQRGLIGLLLI